MVKTIYESEYAAMLVMLRDRRLNAGMTQRELAQRMGVSRLFVGRCERGDRRIDIIEFLAFCRALDLNPKALIAELEQRRERG